MALKITLKPNERIIIGGAVVQNGPGKSELTIENDTPILRQKYILGPDDASTPAKRIYFAVQLMYVDEANLSAHHQLYWVLVRDFISAAPGALAIIDQISEHILQTRYYDALKTARRLIQYEEEVLDRVQQRS